MPLETLNPPPHDALVTSVPAHAQGELAIDYTPARGAEAQAEVGNPKPEAGSEPAAVAPGQGAGPLREPEAPALLGTAPDVALIGSGVAADAPIDAVVPTDSMLAADPAPPLDPVPAVPAAPTAGELLYADAKARTERGDLVGARRVYRELIVIDATHIRARNNLALLLEAAGDGDGAVAQLTAALECEPDNVALLCNRANTLTALNRYDAAEADLRRALKDQPDHVDALVQFAVLRSKRARWREAIEPLRRAIELAPGHAPAHYYLGEAYNHVDLLTPALEAFKAAVALAPGNGRAYKSLGNVLDRLGRNDEAAVAHRKAREVQTR